MSAEDSIRFLDELRNSIETVTIENANLKSEIFKMKSKQYDVNIDSMRFSDESILEKPFVLYHPILYFDKKKKCSRCDAGRKILVDDTFQTVYKMCDCFGTIPKLKYDSFKVNFVAQDDNKKIYIGQYKDLILNIPEDTISDGFNPDIITQLLKKNIKPDILFYKTEEDCKELCRRFNDEIQLKD